MTKDDIFAKIKEILVTEFEIDEGSIKPESLLYDELEFDSIDAVDLLVKMKQFIPGKVEPALFSTARTVQDVVELLYPLLNL